MKNTLRRLFTGTGISRPAYLIMRYGLALCAVMLAACLLIAVYIGPPSLHNHRLYSLMALLYREPQSILLVISLGSLIVDGLIKQGR